MSILEKIVARKREEVAQLPARRIDVEMLSGAMANRSERRDFMGALRQAGSGDVALIAEIKKASPSAGLICRDFDPVAMARAYASAGASCLSVLTDRDFFQGSLDYLRDVRKAVSVPLLRKDFVVDDRQILEAIEWGADAVLLIVAILSDEELSRFHQLAVGAGLAALVEVHNEEELYRAIKVGATLIGVNNRDLKTFEVDLGTTERLGKLLAESMSGHFMLVAESGIHERKDVVRLKEAGASAILVGESLMRKGVAGVEGKARELLGREDGGGRRTEDGGL